MISSLDVDPDALENRCCITKTKGGNLIAAIETRGEIGCFRSVDNGINWTSRADVYETAAEHDHCLLFPANTADDNDAAALFWDRSANEITVKMYDDSANTWTETAILSGMVDDLKYINMDGAVRHSDGFILGCAHTNGDDPGDDLVTFTVNPNSIASPAVVTTTANVFTNQGESAQCAIHINQQNDDVRITYLKGNPTWQETVDVVYHLSTDNMASWGAEKPYSEAVADDHRRVSAGRTTGDAGGFFQPVWYNDDQKEIYANLVNDVAIAAAAEGVGPPAFAHATMQAGNA